MRVSAGRNGDVYAATLIGQSVVVKRFDKTENPKTALAAKQSFLQEAYMMMPLRHPNILPYAVLFCIRFIPLTVTDIAFGVTCSHPQLPWRCDNGLRVPDCDAAVTPRLP
jgi:hypothetical protein